MIGLEIIPYYSSIRHFMSSCLMHFDPWSYVISVGLVYIFNHIVSTQFTIYIARLLSYCVILNHPVKGSTTVTYLKLFLISFHLFL